MQSMLADGSARSTPATFGGARHSGQEPLEVFATEAQAWVKNKEPCMDGLHIAHFPFAHGDG